MLNVFRVQTLEYLGKAVLFVKNQITNLFLCLSFRYGSIELK